MLRDAKANLEARSREGYTPLYMAAHVGHAAVVALLRDAKVNLETPDKNGKSPFDIAKEKGNTDVVILLSAALKTKR